MRSDVPVLRVLLVDEQEVVRRGVARVLRGDAGITVVGQARSAGEALRWASAMRPDVVVVAMRLPDGSGAHVCQRLRALVPGVRCLMLSDSVDAETVQAAVRAGASGCLSMHVSGRALVAAVRSVAVRISGPPPARGPVVAASTRVTLQNVVAEAGAW